MQNIVMHLRSIDEGKNIYELKYFSEIEDINVKRLVKIYDNITIEIGDMIMDNDFTYNEVALIQYENIEVEPFLIK